MDPFHQSIAITIITGVMGTLIGWLMSGMKEKARELSEKTQQEEIERRQNRDILGMLLFYRLEDLHRRYVVEGVPCSAADKQQVDDIYHHYHEELGLNGPGTHMYNEIMEAHQR